MEDSTHSYSWKGGTSTRDCPTPLPFFLTLSVPDLTRESSSFLDPSLPTRLAPVQLEMLSKRCKSRIVDHVHTLFRNLRLLCLFVFLVRKWDYQGKLDVVTIGLTLSSVKFNLKTVRHWGLFTCGYQ